MHILLVRILCFGNITITIGYYKDRIFCKTVHLVCMKNVNAFQQCQIKSPFL